MKITRCKTNHIVNPLGYKLDDTVLSWTVELDCREQETGGNESGNREIPGTKGAADGQDIREDKKLPVLYRIEVSKEEQMEKVLFDSGYDEAILSTGYRLPLALKARTRYYWRVHVKRGMEETVGDVNWFETAKQEEAWQAEWISTETETTRHPLFFKTICTQGEVKRARLYLCGLGLYEAYWNGEKIGREYLTPYCNNYHQWLQYQTYDMTDMVRKTSQAELSVLLGDGWYKGRFTYERSRDTGFYGDRRMLIAELHVEYADGRAEVFSTGADWEVKESRIIFSNIYDGEQMDDTLPDTQPVRACICEAPKGALMARMSLPVTVYCEMPVTEIHTPNGEKVFDIGQNITGIFQIKADVPKGQTIHIQFGEELQDGNFYRENLRTAKAEYIYVSAGSPKEIRPHFTFYGGRYLRITGAPDIKAEDISILVLTTELEETGSLSVGDPLVNQLISNIQWSRRGNFLDVPTDCPQRDERMGWTGDAQIFCPTACYQTDAYAFYRKYLYDMWTEQQMRQGMVPNVVPSFGLQGYSPVWGDAAVIIPWTLYQFTGDGTILEEQYPSMKAWVDFMRSLDGEDCGWRRVSCFGDWLALDRVSVREGDCDGATDKDFIADVFYMYSTELLAETADVLKAAEDVEEYRCLAANLRNRIKEEFYSANGRCCVNTQTGLLLTLRHGLADMERTRAALRRKLESNLNRLDTGFIGTAYICNVLAENGMSDLAEKLLLNEEYPGWLREVRMGATTIWERWNSLDDQGHFSSNGMNSLNHYAYGAVMEWMYRHLAGIRAAEPGFRRVNLCPTPVWKLKKLDCTYESAAGRWESSWQIADETHITLRICVPVGCSARLTLPCNPQLEEDNRGNPMLKNYADGVCELQEGRYEITYRTKTALHRIFSVQMTAAELMGEPEAKHVLMQIFPQIAQLPVSMQDVPLKHLLKRFGAEALAEVIDKKLMENVS